MGIPQFGTAEPGFDYPDRAAAFAVIERDGLIALARVSGSRYGEVFDLPGGGVEPGESEPEAAVREAGEEVGLKIAVERDAFTRADQLWITYGGHRRNTRSVFFEGRVLAEEPALKIEDDHELAWLAPLDAVAGLYRDSHRWALAAWLRLRALA